MSAQHTPGPWRLDKDDLLILGPLGVRGVIAEVQSHNEAGALIPECEGNSRLIATAPDLLAALQALAQHAGPYIPRSPSLAQAYTDACAAIVRATGSAS